MEVREERNTLRSSALKSSKSSQDGSPEMQSKMTKKVNKTDDLF